MTLLAIRLLLGGWLKSALAFARTIPPKEAVSTPMATLIRGGTP